jgi:hypothetical protein
MEKIPTAEEVMQKHLDPHDCLRVSKCYEMTLDAMKEFAKIHVEAALKEASEKAKMIDVGIDYSIILWEVDKDSIINSYPVENIK